MYVEIYQFIAGNKELLRFVYSAIIVFICLIIVLKTNRLFQISSHQGIRYFRNAFFFYGLAFMFRCVIGITWNYPFIIKGLFEFFIVMGGFFLFYSLLWKMFETNKEISSLFNSKIFIFYIFALMIVILNYLWGGYFFMFSSQIILFGFASIVSYKNYKKRGKEYGFLKLYFVVMLLNFIAWSLNFVFVYFFDGRLRWLANVYVLNVIIFLIFLYGVIKVTKK